MKYYIIRTDCRNFIALDEASGGYPYLVDTWHHAKIWHDEQSARKYMKSFSQDSVQKQTPWTLCEIEAKLRPL